MGVGETGSVDRCVREEVAELLGVSPGEVDPDADLIASGLDSIRMMSLSGRWRKRGIDVNFAALAQQPTVAAWTALVAGRASRGGPESTAQPALGEQTDPFPLAPIQQALWLGRDETQQLGGVAAHLYVEFDGIGVDPQRLRVAAAKLAARHPMLRVEILPDGMQRVGDRELDVSVIDLRDLGADDAAKRLTEIREAKSHQMLHDEVLELSLSLLPGGATRLHVDMDMQAADAVSYRNFMADLAAFYRGEELTALNYTYREYRSALTAAATAPDEDRRWWAQRIPHLPEPPALPLVPPSEQNNPRRNTRRWHFFDSATRDALFAAARRHGVTPAMVVAASYAGTLARWSTSRHLLLNLPMFGREPFHPDVDKLVGDFSSSLMLDIDLTGANTALARSRIVQAALHTSARHSNYSGLSVLRDLSRHRGSQALAPFVFTSALGLGDLFAGDVTEQFGTPVWHISQGPQVLLDAQVTPFDGGLLMNWDVREEAFRPGVIDAMFAYHLAELTRLATDDSSWAAPDPPAVTEAQRTVRDAVNGVTTEPSGDALHDGFFRAAARQPDAPAVFSSLGDLSYGQLAEQSLAVATTLRQYGIAAGDTVAVMGPKTPEQIPALLGILATGGVYLPIGADQPDDRAARILQTADVRLALVCGDRRDPVGLPTLTVAEAIRSGADSATRTSPAATDPAELAYVLFTSGSTGEPKGVEVTHDAAMNTIEFINRHFEIGPADRCLALSTLECDLSVLDIFGTLRSGGSIVVVDERHRRDPDTWARLIDQHGVTVLHFMPGWLEMLVAVVPADSRRLSTVRVVPTGGDWVRTQLAQALRTRAPGARFAGLGGATETATHNTICEPADIPASWTALPFGTPLPNNACRVVAADGTDCPDWVPGEFWVGGRGVARGYRGRPELTAAKFVRHDGRNWYRTGDLVRYLPDGAVEFVGRVDHRIKISGYRVELGEVEVALERVPGVDAAVAAVVSGERDTLAALTTVTDADLDSEAITTALTELLPAHMIPKVIVVTDRIPFGVNGKIDRKAVARQLAEAEVPTAPAYRAPSTPLESALAAIVGEVLDARVGVDDDFFCLGGDSVLATQVIARVRDWLDAPTALVTDMFATRCVSKLAERLAGREPVSERLDAVAEVYLAVAGMDAADVLSELESSAQGSP
ncbi:amino acid adenylation domain-containing protein [Mycolicibacterium sp. ND9-15]|uniref:non-ribosomal peptide synthetase n=1 Tax=Mycolicibacterium sp. ND9-15 TaxID=3042320 RepID=UPI002DDBD17F|nr:amino acid adenylation domain-containing protein [Mycolicibacterium sp. ND9-15]WSE55781.1 amino acid adenylation domain-containing protein [Mycolicibacterium sp. ND9-15]